eukprot:TRINITY_DN9744_c0_g1_i1.p1 TRINITY_DN9744_c0_g1~~TRINITY_DN9744_c0_g1_i1.p1  ORF type:complete len:318 (+),score=61.32 TRINITY_DN9744_c0_g1_i1:150-1103(+)
MGVVDTDGEKRRLPSWMLGVSAADQLRKSGNKDENNVSIEEQSSCPSSQPKAKPIARRHEKKVITREREDSEVDSSFLVRCETREGTRKSSRQHADPKNLITGCSEVMVHTKAKKKRNGVGRTIRGRATPKKRTLKNCEVENSDEIEAPSPTDKSEDGVELTMEDLMSMAEECVKADKEKELQQETTTEPPSKSECSSNLIFPRNRSGDSLQATTTGRSCDLTETARMETESTVNEGIAVTASRTGDPAQDMLDLFLGPLLKKPRTEENKLELVTEDVKTFASQHSEQAKSGVVVEEGALLVKKKSSLKDKVARFLV